MMDDKDFFKRNYKIAKKLLEDLVSINTVEKDITDIYPFGKGIAKAQKVVENFCIKYGFNYTNRENYVSYIHFGPKNSYINILAHIDVVPEGLIQKWNSNPYTLVTKNNTLFGRGVIDNKASIVYGLMTLKYLKDNNIKLKNGIRVIIGNDEESGFLGIKHYKKVEDSTKLSFVLDNLFPAVNIEKGVLNFDILIDNRNKIALKGGNARNTIADNCSITENGINNKFYANPGHGSNAQTQLNAITYALNQSNDKNLKNISKKIDSLVHNNIFIKNECSFNIGRAYIREEKIILECELRFATDNLEEITNLIRKKFSGYDVIIQSEVKEKIFNIKLVNYLTNEYNNFFKTQLKPVSSGYISYAHTLSNSVPFGPFKPNNTSLHSYNEYLPEKDFKSNILFYIQTFTKIIQSANLDDFI